MQNKLLAKIPDNERERLQPHLHEIKFEISMILSAPDQPIEFVHFPTDGVLSMVNETEDGEIVEFATIGNEGMAGVPILLGTNSMPSTVLVQVPGAGFQMRSGDLLEILPETPVLHGLLMRHVMALLNQVAQSTSCNRLHEVQERCARWLLHTHDRVSGDHFQLTQEFLSQMLGVHRPTVSIAARILQQAGLIKYSRGHIQVLDRKGLEAASCGCYRIIATQYARLLDEQ